MKKLLLVVSLVICPLASAIADDRLILSEDEQYLGTKVNDKSFLTCSNQTIPIGSGRIVHVTETCDSEIKLTLRVDDVDQKNRLLFVSTVSDPTVKFTIAAKDTNAQFKWEKIRPGDQLVVPRGKLDTYLYKAPVH